MTHKWLWDYEATLSCRCVVKFGHRTTDEIRDLTPRRQDGTFGALCCPRHGRRRIVFTSSWATLRRAA